MAEKQSGYSRNSTRATGLSRRMIALLWLLGIGLVIGVLIHYEQISILYVLATLALVILLLVVAFADLETVGREAADGFAGKKE